MNPVCVVCQQDSRYVSPYYRHAFRFEDTQFAGCKPPAVNGLRQCWNCGVKEDAATDTKTHDFMGWGKFTCEAPPRIQRCMVCHEPTGHASQYYKHAYVPEDVPIATCLPPAIPPNRTCWVCGARESVMVTPAEFYAHDFTGRSYPGHSCTHLPPPPAGQFRCPRCEEITHYREAHEHDDSMGYVTWTCQERKGIFKR